MRTEVQKVTLRCPVNRHLATVEVRCKVLDHDPGPGQERRILQEILSCTLVLPEVGCHPACEEDIRRLVEY